MLTRSKKMRIETSQENLFALIEREASVPEIRAWLQQNPGQINNKQGEKTALSVACRKGYANIVNILLNHGAITDDGCMNMHYICMLGAIPSFS